MDPMSRVAPALLFKLVIMSTSASVTVADAKAVIALSSRPLALRVPITRPAACVTPSGSSCRVST